MAYSVGETVKGTVSGVTDYGAFVRLEDGSVGMIHISKLAKERVEKVEDVVSIGDTVAVKVIEIDDQGRVNMMRIVD